MKAARGVPEISSELVNGHRMTGEFPEASTGQGTSPPQNRATANRETTRYLAAATQVDTKYAANVVDRVFGEPLKALAPAYGIDVAVVAKWALKALRTRAARDLFLAAVLILQVLFVALAIMTSPWLLIAFPLLFVMAWAAVAWEYWERVHHCIVGQLLRGRFDPEKAPSPRRADERAPGWTRGTQGRKPCGIQRPVRLHRHGKDRI